MDWVWKLHKAIYGLKQAGHQWYLKVRELFEDLGLKRCENNQGVFYLHLPEFSILITVHVDNCNLVTRRLTHECFSYVIFFPFRALWLYFFSTSFVGGLQFLLPPTKVRICSIFHFLYLISSCYHQRSNIRWSILARFSRVFQARVFPVR